MTNFDTELLNQINKDHQYIVDLRRYFHQNPEIAKEEFNTALKIEAELDLLGISHKRAGETGVYAEIKGEKTGPQNKTIVLRADIDALPIQETHICQYTSRIDQRMHACGHDMHTACLIGAARILVKNKDKFSGTIRLNFQQGEEIGYGAKVFINEGFLNGADRTFGIHAESRIPSGKLSLTAGPNNASVDWFKISVKGHPAHVSTPQLGCDAAYIAAQILVSLQALITRCTSPMDNVLIGIGKITAGEAYNIVAQNAELEGTIRVFKPEIRKQIKEKLTNIAVKTAEIYGGTAEIEFQDFTSPLINDEKSTEEAQQTAFRIFGKDAVITNRQPALGGDDFAEYIIKVPGVYAYIGTGNSSRPETQVAHHDSMFDIDEESMKIGVAIYTAYAIDFLNTDSSY